MPTHELSGTTALVTGASRGFGRAIAVALSKHGAHVAGVARDPGRLEELHQQLGGTFTPVAADAADPVVAGQLLDKYRPRTLVLNAGAAPVTRPGAPCTDRRGRTEPPLAPWPVRSWARDHEINHSRKRTTMRKLIESTLVSLDGVIEAPERWPASTPRPRRCPSRNWATTTRSSWAG
jgi:NAD(P)-dependent dehydrogenase (short-subunit alcohol dehydrogenase family)